MNNKTLLFLTSSYPFGKGETFIENEIHFLAQKFEKVIIVSNDTQSNDKRETPENVTVLRHSYNLDAAQKIKALIKIFSLDFWKEIWFVLTMLGTFPSKKIVFTALSTAYKSNILKQFILSKTGIKSEQHFVAYSYWSDDSAVAVAMLKLFFPNMKNVCRAHRWDVYFDKQKKEYLPFRKLLAKNTDQIFFISDHAKKFFIEKNRIAESSLLAVSRLGTIRIQKADTLVTTDAFYIVSCSHLIPRKRVLLLAQGLLQVKSPSPIVWTHFGDGEESVQLEAFINKHFASNSSVKVNLKGSVPNKLIREFYAGQKVDLFVNVSESEGVPVSIMEAMSVGIPVVATDVDAVNEIVKYNFNGILLSKNPSPQEVTNAILKFIEMNEQEKQTFNQNAFEFWNKNYNAEKNYEDFTNRLLNL